MFNLFNYNTLDVKLKKETKSLLIFFKKDKNYITHETLFELESIFAWAANRLEISSIILDSHNEFFNEGLHKDRLPGYGAEKLSKMCAKLQKIVHAMLHLPQVIIVNLKAGAFDLASELSLGADFRICSHDAMIAFNHNLIGLTPSSGGISILTQLMGNTLSRQWLLSGKKIEISKLINTGFIYQSYDLGEASFIIDELAMSVNQSAPIQRIQTKLALLECMRESVDQAMESERKIAKASLVSEDWKSEDHMPAKHMQEAIKILKRKEEQNLES